MKVNLLNIQPRSEVTFEPGGRATIAAVEIKGSQVDLRFVGYMGTHRYWSTGNHECFGLMNITSITDPPLTDAEKRIEARFTVIAKLANILLPNVTGSEKRVIEDILIAAKDGHLNLRPDDPNIELLKRVATRFAEMWPEYEPRGIWLEVIDRIKTLETAT